MLEQITSGLLVAGITGVTFVAYKHPAGYRTFYPLLHYGSLLVLIIGTVWNAAVDITWLEISSFIAPDKGSQVLQARESLKVPYVWFWLGCLGVTFYAFFLLNLHEILGKARRFRNN